MKHLILGGLSSCGTCFSTRAPVLPADFFFLKSSLLLDLLAFPRWSMLYPGLWANACRSGWLETTCLERQERSSTGFSDIELVGPPTVHDMLLLCATSSVFPAMGPTGFQSGPACGVCIISVDWLSILGRILQAPPKSGVASWHQFGCACSTGMA